MQLNHQWIKNHYASGANTILNHALCMLVLLFGLTACSQSDTDATSDNTSTNNQRESPSDGDTPDPVINTTSASIIFPPANSLHDEKIITVRGVATPNKGARITEVSVNGIAATSGDNFATWTIENFPLRLGNNELVLAIKDNQGNTINKLDTANIKVQVMPNLSSFNHNALIVDKHNNRALIMNNDATGAVPSGDAIIAIDLSTGKRTVLSSLKGTDKLFTPSAVGKGVRFYNASNIDFDAGNNRAIVSDGLQKSLTQVDLSTGKRTSLIKFDFKDKNKNLQNLRGAVLDNKNNRILYIEGFNDRCDVIEYKFSNKKISVVSDYTNKKRGIIFRMPSSLVFDDINNFLYVYDRRRRAIIKVDLNKKGLRTIVSDKNTGTGPSLNGTSSLRLNTNKTLAIAANHFSKSLIEIDLNTGNRRVVSGYIVNDDDKKTVLVGTGEAFLSPKGVDYADDNTLVVIDEGRDNPVMVDISTGNRSDLGNRHIGIGPRLNAPAAIAQHNGQLLVVDYANSQIVSVDPNSGDRKVVLNGADTSVLMNKPTYIAHDPSKNRLFVMDQVDERELPRILEWRIGSANPEVIFETDAENKAFTRPSAMLFDAKRNRLIITNHRYKKMKLLSLDLTTKKIQVLSGLDGETLVGEGDVFDSIRVATFKDDDTLFLIDNSQEQLYEVDLNTGARKKLFNPISHKDNRLVNLSNIHSMKYNAIAQQLLIARDRNLSMMDLTTGDMKSISSAIILTEDNRVVSGGEGFGFNFGNIIDFSFNLKQNLIYLIDLKHSAILQLDLISGQRTVLSWKGSSAVIDL